jgi:hypothetical protein
MKLTRNPPRRQMGGKATDRKAVPATPAFEPGFRSCRVVRAILTTDYTDYTDLMFQQKAMDSGFRNFLIICVNLRNLWFNFCFRVECNDPIGWFHPLLDFGDGWDEEVS